MRLYSSLLAYSHINSLSIHPFSSTCPLPGHGGSRWSCPNHIAPAPMAPPSVGATQGKPPLEKTALKFCNVCVTHFSGLSPRKGNDHIWIIALFQGPFTGRVDTKYVNIYHSTAALAYSHEADAAQI
uniref:Uncharacterized protein n=1 Tax=Neogobius melanostomus TaxID=47308 RepID=A0A8C6SR07_9GOBI